jgi:5-methylcytosine-specific restriction endonuclease McrA
MPTTYRRNRDALRDATKQAGGVCVHCRRHFNWSAHPRAPLAFTADHIIPRAVGGTDDPANLTPAHYGCNSSRGKRAFDPVTTNATPTDTYSETWP